MVVDRIFGEAHALAQRGEPFALVTIIKTLGSAPREVGTTMLVRPDGSIVGTIGGGRIEARVIEETRKAIAVERTGIFEINPLSAVDQRCGGAMTFFLDVHPRTNPTH